MWRRIERFEGKKWKAVPHDPDVETPAIIIAKDRAARRVLVESVDGPNEAHLVERALAGDREAAGRLVSRHEGAVYAVALARVGDPERAQEVAQEAFVKALAELKSLRDARRFGGYVVRIAARVAADLHRRRKTRPMRDVADPAPGPLEALDRGERRMRVRAELERLPADVRRVFLLRHLEGASYARIAALLEIPEGTVAWTLHRARRSLASSLKYLMEDGP